MPIVSQNQRYDNIICKWELNGTPYYNNITTAASDCKLIGYTGLEGTAYFKPGSNEQNIIETYINSSHCNR